jgi:hypothetical protein
MYRVALQCIVFNLHTALAYISHDTLHIRNALDGWYKAWNARSNLGQSEAVQDNSQAEGWRRDGFIRHADEFRALALMSLDDVDSSGRKGTGKPSDKNNSRSPYGLLDQYDETSMRQVADLMLAFQSLSTT